VGQAIVSAGAYMCLCVYEHLCYYAIVFLNYPTITQEDSHMASTVKSKVKVSERALIGRVNRVITIDNEVLRICREDTRGFNELGRYYSIDTSRNLVASKNIDLEQWGRELGVLKAYETLDT